MQRIERFDSRPSHPTITAVYQKTSYPTLNISVPDNGAQNGVLTYDIKVVKVDGQYRYGLYFDGQKVVYPHMVFASYQQAFDDHILSHANSQLAKRIYKDLGVEKSVITAAHTLSEIDTPPPKRFRKRKPEVKIIERKTPVLREKVPTIEEKVEEAEEQIRTLVAQKKLPVYALKDSSGYFTNIVDNTTGQIHQVGFSWKKNEPWHTVFQLRENIDPIRGYYQVPEPYVRHGKLEFDELANNPWVTRIYEKAYQNEPAIKKLLVRDMLGMLDEKAKAFCFGKPLIRSSQQVLPPNVIPFAAEQPNWLSSFLKEMRQEQGKDEKAFSPRRHPVSDEDAVPVIRTGRHRVPVPGDYGWRANEIVDPKSLPEWLQSASWESKKPPGRVSEPRLERLGLDSRGMPKPLYVSRPLHDTTAAKTRQFPLLPLPEGQRPKVRYAPKQPEVPASFGGYTGPHIQYQLI